MPIQTTDDRFNKTAIYYEAYKSGATISDIARHFDRSINTVKKYLREHPKYEDPGSGNHTKRGSTGVKPNKYYHQGSKQLTFNCPQELLEKIDLVPGRNRKDKYLKAFKLYTRKLPKNRSAPVATFDKTDVSISFYCPQDLVDKLDSNKDVPKSLILSRNKKFIAALELLIEKHAF